MIIKNKLPKPGTMVHWVFFSIGFLMSIAIAFRLLTIGVTLLFKIFLNILGV